MAMGGWASAVYLQYVRPSFRLYAAAQAALANAGYITAQSIRAMHSHLPQPSYDRDRFTKPPADAFKPTAQIFEHFGLIAYCVDKWSKKYLQLYFVVVLSFY
jgi:hypothetical protein